jgi:hypothetical protein
MISSGIEPATFRLVAYFLNQLRYRVPKIYNYGYIRIQDCYFRLRECEQLQIIQQRDLKHVNSRFVEYEKFSSNSF